MTKRYTKRVTGNKEVVLYNGLEITIDEVLKRLNYHHEHLNGAEESAYDKGYEGR